MFKFAALLATIFIGATSAGLIQTHHVVQPVIAKVGAVVHSVPSAVSHQSFTQVHSKAVIQPVIAPVLKTTVHAAPIVPVVKTVVAPVVHTYAAAPVVKTYAPVVKTYAAAPIVKSYPAPIVHSVPVVHAAPLVKTISAAPVAYGHYH